MKRTDRLKEIDKFWKSRPRDIHWDDITWEPFTVDDDPLNLEMPRVANAITSEGYYFWMRGFGEEGSEMLAWDWALLHLLYTWYYLPEDCDAPLFVNEAAGVVCIPDVKWAERLALLFQHPTSVLIGMENLAVEIEAQYAAGKSKAAAASVTNPGYRAMNREAAMAFLNADSEATK